MLINALVITIVLLSAFSNKKHKGILCLLCCSYSIQYLFSINHSFVYQSAFIADAFVFIAATKRNVPLNNSIAIISVLFMASHIYGLIAYLLGEPPYTYNNLLKALYVILIIAIIKDGGIGSGLKRYIKHFVHGLVLGKNTSMDIHKGNKK